MGVYGCMKFAQRNGLVLSQTTCLAKGVLIPIAVDLWNVMYGLMEKFYPERAERSDDAVWTLRCLFSMLKLLHRRSYYPIFVFDGGVDGEMRAEAGAKAIVAKAFAVTSPCSSVGSGRLIPMAHCHEDKPKTDRRAAGEQISSGPQRCEGKRAKPEASSGEGDAVDEPPKCRWSTARWSSKPETPRVIHRLCVGMIRRLGYAYVESASAEADDLCANLFHTKTVAYVLSSDTDLLLMGCDIIVDITHFFPSVIRCKDVLRSLEMDYPTFLTKFVRCHTDLHKEPTLKSMQEIVEMLGKSKRSKSRSSDDKKNTVGNGPSDHRDPGPSKETVFREGNDEEGFVLVTPKHKKNRKGRETEYLRRKTNPEVDGGEELLHCRQDRGCWVTYIRGEKISSADSNGLDPVNAAEEALFRMAPAKTLCEVLERKFIKHVVAILTPEKRTPRVSILKRVPITQERKDELAIRDLLFEAIEDRNVAEAFYRTACKKTHKLSSYGKALSAYWD